jgi:hypothetical protein
MIPYASNTGTRRNLAALRANDWRILITPAKPVPPKGMRYGIDNGAWGTRDHPERWDAQAFASLVDKIGHGADFIVLPDIVCGGCASLDLSISWLHRLYGFKKPLWRDLPRHGEPEAGRRFRRMDARASTRTARILDDSLEARGRISPGWLLYGNVTHDEKQNIKLLQALRGMTL